MFFSTDVHYDDETDSAVAAAVGFWHSSEARPRRQFTQVVHGIAPYEPGAFYKRELPCLLALLDAVRQEEPLDLVFVDGHAWLTDGQGGLGHHLWCALGEQVPVVGVAKAAFHGGVAVEVHRGGSAKPLYVTAVGVDTAEAVAFVRRMHGPHRLPTLLAQADALCRGR